MKVSKAEILIIDDEPQIRKLLEITLRSNDYLVKQAGSAKEGLIMAETHPPDLVLLDLVMPDLTGADVLAEMSRDPELQRIPVIVVTSVDPSAIAVSEVGQVVDVVTKQQLDRQSLARGLARVRGSER